MRRIVAALLAVGLLQAGWTAQSSAQTVPPSTTTQANPITILIAIDGFRAEYLDRGLTPNLKALADAGVRSEMRPSFPSVTLPNFRTLLTGKRPDRHGILGNEFENGQKVAFAAMDPATKTTNYWDPSWWKDALPLWASIEAAGGRTVHLYTPAVGLDAKGKRPANLLRLSDSTKPAEEPAELFKWIDLPSAKRPAFITLYFYPVDHQGHHHGPNSPELNAALGEVDAAVGQVVSGLRQRDMLARTNIVIVADHGMAEVKVGQDIILDDLIAVDRIRPISLGAYAAIEPAKDVTVDELTGKMVGRHGHLECWRKENLPARFRFGHHPWIAPIFCLADNGWNITTRAIVAKRSTAAAASGNHGFDPAEKDMAALFIANGPAFKAGMTLKPFDNSNVYFLLAKLTGTKPEPGDGSLTPFRSVLKAK